MHKYVICFMSLLLVGCAFAQSTEPVIDTVLDSSLVVTAPVFSTSVAARAPILVTTHPEIRAKYAGHEDLLLKFRASENLPEVINESLLGGPASANTGKIGTKPRLTVLPCDIGCSGNSDYDKAVNSFLTSYAKSVVDGAYEFRGSMTVKVRWFKQRSYFERQLPIPGNQDTFAISFPLEGKLITLSARDGGDRSAMDALTTSVSGLLSIQLVLQAGIGVKPSPLQALLPTAELSWLNKFDNAVAPQLTAFITMLGGKDYRSRIEPMTAADNVLLPAVDGIEPNEIDPITETVFLNSM
jgi:hypothetical protein